MSLKKGLLILINPIIFALLRNYSNLWLPEKNKSNFLWIDGVHGMGWLLRYFKNHLLNL
jgi:hypothetical protein